MNAVQRGIVVALLGLAVSWRGAAAQAASPSPGDRVRVNACESGGGGSCRHIVGAFVSWTPDQIVVRDSLGRDLGIAAGPRSELEVSRGRRSLVGRGLLFGFLGGAGLGGILALTCAEDAGEDAGMCLGWLPMGAGAGTVVGALIGAMSTSERWASVRPPEGLTIGSSGAGVRIGFAQTF